MEAVEHIAPSEGAEDAQLRDAMQPQMKCGHSVWGYAEIDGQQVPICLSCGYYVRPRRIPATV